VCSIFDFHNCTEESLDWPQLITIYRHIIDHVHLNEKDGGYPGSGASEFLPAFKALENIKFSGWISLEVFNQKKPPEVILEATSRFIHDMEDRLQTEA
jgi:sugar phosphate isomerase/epimerase